MKYVITLDTDTQLPRDSARQFVGTMSHPLNNAQYDEKKQRVNEGYGILQPRVAVSLPGTNISRYAKLFGSDPGIDPYTRAVSDVYQDLFGEGSFIGKGIYDVDIFEHILNERFPENKILSHDLLEGCYARSGLLSDVLLFEEYPSSYITDVNRRHRWIRGDWQMVQWLLPIVPGLNRRLQKNPLSGLSRLKIFDNLRRSVTPLALMLLLLLGWTLLSQLLFWTLSVIGIILLPSLIISILDLFHKQTDVLLKQHLTNVIHSAARHFAQAAFTLVCLPYEAFYSLDAITRTVWRLLVSHKQLLEWNHSGIQDCNSQSDIIGTYRTMWIGPVIALSSLIFLAFSQPAALAFVWPLLCAWFASPLIAWWLSLTLVHHRARLTADQTIFLRKLSRKTWAFFETFVGPEDHWLPPDNYQEHPVPTIAHRTSPTNMGLSLLANLSAYDFGYIMAGQLIERTTNAFQTMEIMERYRGHFFNWYDTQSLKPLRPGYISSVDSGNLTGHLLVLRAGLLSLPDHKILDLRLFELISDTLRILEEVKEGASKARLVQFRKDLKFAVNSQPVTLTAAKLCLDQLAKSATEVAEEPVAEPETQALWWARALARQCRNALDELIFLTPWIMLPACPDKVNDFPGIDGIPTLRELAKLDTELLPAIGRWLSTDAPPEEIEWVDTLRRSITEASNRARERIASIECLARQSGEFANMEYGFLYDK